MSKAAKSNSKQVSPAATEVTFARISASRIIGMHPILKALYEELSIPPLRQVVELHVNLTRELH